jgi:hypothetical protein
MTEIDFIIQSVIQTTVILYVLIDIRTRLCELEKSCKDRLQFCLSYNKDGVK